jgi:hypothetical protein
VTRFSVCCIVACTMAIWPIAPVTASTHAVVVNKAAMLQYQSQLVTGEWNTTHGPMTLVATPQPDGTIAVTGWWIKVGKHGNGMKGTIKEGTYDPVSQTLRFRYYQSWNSAKGQAIFKLSGNHRVGQGFWQQGTERYSNNGMWTMQRPEKWKAPKAPN